MPLKIDPGTVTKADMAADTQEQIQTLMQSGMSGEVEATFFNTLVDNIIGEGSVGVISSLSDSSMVDEMYTSPSFVVTYNYSDESLDNIDATEMGIAVSTYPYTSIFDEPDDSRGDAGNSQVDLFSSVSDFSSPITEVLHSTSDREDHSRDTQISATYSSSEIEGLTSRFGFSTTLSVSEAFEQTVYNLALEVVQTTLSDRFTFQHTDFYSIGPRNFPLLSLVRASAITGSGQTPAAASTTSMGGY